MKVTVRPKQVELLNVSRLIQQTSFWSRLKGRQGLLPLAFDIKLDDQSMGDILILLDFQTDSASKVQSDTLQENIPTIAYVPFGPEFLPEECPRGLFITGLSQALQEYLPGTLFIRWDLPWRSFYADDPKWMDHQGHWIGPPEARLRELRMNWGIDGTALRKAPSDILPPDTIQIALEKDEDRQLAKMKPKTRYNIRLAQRKDVKVRTGSPEDIPIWDALYYQTARRNRLRPHRKGSFRHLFEVSRHTEGVHLLIAEKDAVPLAAMFLSVSGLQASYLYGASADSNRNLMAPYALQWAAMCKARQLGCDNYDLFGVAPRPDPDHPMHGLYVFKSGFGGSLLHRQGAWDYPYNQSSYTLYRAKEEVEGSFHL